VSSGQTILIVDDDAHIREVVRFALDKAGFKTFEAGDGRAALEVFDRSSPSLVVLDILMPEMDGTDVCRQLRSRSRVPIVFLSSKDDEVDRIVALELGGDDYITKPFSPRELVARVRAVLRRAMPDPAIETDSQTAARDKPKVMLHNRLKLDLDRFQAFWGDQEVVLTVTEFGILRTLMGYPGKVFSRGELMDGAYPEQNIVTERTIDSHVRRVRRKFASVGGDPIETVHGVGYKLGECR
jgi:two-component system OmpR family response regulator